MGEPRNAGQQPEAEEAEVIEVEADLENGAGESGPGSKHAVPGSKPTVPQKPPAGPQPDIKYQG